MFDYTNAKHLLIVLFIHILMLLYKNYMRQALQEEDYFIQAITAGLDNITSRTNKIS
jgi:hypothetical protein